MEKWKIKKILQFFEKRAKKCQKRQNQPFLIFQKNHFWLIFPRKNFCDPNLYLNESALGTTFFYQAKPLFWAGGPKQRLIGRAAANQPLKRCLMLILGFQPFSKFSERSELTLARRAKKPEFCPNRLFWPKFLFRPHSP